MTKTPRENRVPIMLSDEELRAIDDWRFANRVATRSDAIRRLCQVAMFYGDRAGEMNDLAREISERVKPLSETKDAAAWEAGAYDIIELAISLASDVGMIGQSHRMFADGEQAILFERAETARQKFREARARRVAAEGGVKSEMDARLSSDADSDDQK